VGVEGDEPHGWLLRLRVKLDREYLLTRTTFTEADEFVEGVDA